MWTTFVVLDIRHMEQWWTLNIVVIGLHKMLEVASLTHALFASQKVFYLLFGSVCYVERRCIWAQYRRFWETSILQTSCLLENKANARTGARERSRLGEYGRNGGAIEIIFIHISPFMCRGLGFLRVSISFPPPVICFTMLSLTRTV